jgi:hypothetical protein
MKKVIAICLAVVLIAGGVGLGTVFAESNSQPASKATAAVGYINVISAGEPATSTILEQEIKLTGNKKDILCNVSLETALFTETVVKTKNAKRETATAEASVDVRVIAQPLDNQGNPVGDPIIAQPNVIVGYGDWDGEKYPAIYNDGWVTFDYRMQELTAVLQGIINDIICEITDPDGSLSENPPRWSGDEEVSCSIDETTLTEEEIGLMLDTMAAHSFNYILPDLPVGRYNLKVEATVAHDAYVVQDEEDPPGVLGTAEANAFIGLGSVTFETVRMIRGEVIEMEELAPPPAP